MAESTSQAEPATHVELPPTAPGAGAAPPPPEAPPARSVLDEYELGDTGLDPAHDSPAAPAPAAAPAAEAAAPEAPAATPPPAARPAAAKHEHNETVARMAADLGVPQAEIDQTPPDQLGRLVYHLNRQAQLSRGTQLTPPPGQLSPPTQLPRDPGTGRFLPKGAEPPAAVAPEDDLGLPEGEYDPALVKVLKEQRAEIRRLKGLEQRIEHLSRREQKREVETVADRFDKKFAEHEAVFGRGRGRELDGNSAEYQRRIAVLAQIDRDPRPGSFEQKFDRACQLLFGTLAPAPAPAPAAAPAADELRRRQEQYDRGGLARPTHRGQEPRGERKALQTAARVMREQGLLSEEDDDELADSFLQ